MTGAVYRDRAEAGRRLAALCRAYEGSGPLIIGLPRGGVVVAAEIARALRAPLDVAIVRKLGAPTQPELAIGAVFEADGPRMILDQPLVDRLNVPREFIDREAAEQIREIHRREREYRGSQARKLPIQGRTVILVDDGVATGATTRAGLRAVRAQDPALLVLAVPVAAPETLESLRREADDVICPLAPTPFRAVGEFYLDFEQTSDEEVIQLLRDSRERFTPANTGAIPDGGTR